MRRRRFAHSVVVTVSLAELGCAGTRDEEVIHRNPPAPVLDDGGAAEPPPEEKPVEQDSETPPDAKTTDAEPLEIGKPEVKIVKRSDGTCWEETSIDCPPQVACNPPPPKRVECPPDPKPK